MADIINGYINAYKAEKKIVGDRYEFLREIGKGTYAYGIIVIN